MQRRLPCLLLPFVLLSALRAQDDVLAIERQQDLRAYAAAVQFLQRARARFDFEAVAPRALCRLFAALTGDALSFSCAVRDADAGAGVTLHLQNASLWSAMAVAEMQMEHRFVFRAGVVFLVPKDQVEPMTYLVVYDLRPQCAPVRNFPGPRLGLHGAEEEGGKTEAEESTTTVSGFTAEGIEALIRANVTPEQWDKDGISLHDNNGLFLVRQTLRGHRELAVLLDALGLVPLPRAVRVPEAEPLRPPRSGARDP